MQSRFGEGFVSLDGAVVGAPVGVAGLLRHPDLLLLLLVLVLLGDNFLLKMR